MNSRNKKGVRLLALILAVLLAAGAIVSAIIATVMAEEGQTEYSVNAVMMKDEQIISCGQTVSYTNGTGEELSQLFFCCYANALRRFESAPFEAGEEETAYPEGFAPGGIQFYEIRVDGKRAEWAAEGADEAFLRVSVSLAPGEKCTIELEYDILLPVDTLFSGAGSYDWRLTDAFPTVCPFIDGSFRENDVLTTGWFSVYETADWTLRITAPKGYMCIASGKEEAVSSEGGDTVWLVTAPDTRCPAVVLGRSHTLSGTGEIKVYCADGAAAAFIREKAGAIWEYYKSLFGPPLAGEMDIVLSQYAYGFLSAGGIVLVSRELAEAGKRGELEYALAVGLAQQWFGDTAQADVYEAPFLRESTACFAALLYCVEAYGEGRLRTEMEKRIVPSLNVTIPGGVTALSPASYFASRGEYETILRGRGTYAMFLTAQAMGPEGFIACMRSYLESCRGSVAGADDMERAMGKWSGFLWDALFTAGESSQSDWLG